MPKSRNAAKGVEWHLAGISKESELSVLFEKRAAYIPEMIIESVTLSQDELETSIPFRSFNIPEQLVKKAQKELKAAVQPAP